MHTHKGNYGRALALAATLILSGPIAAESVFYGLDNVNQRLFRMDRVTGAASRVGAISYENVRDIAVDARGHLYGVDTVSDTLVRIDPRTGGATAVGTIRIDGDTFLASLDFDPVTKALYGLDYRSGELYRIDVETAGLTHVSTVDQSLREAGAIAFDREGRLFVTDTNRDLLQILDVSSGLTRRVGSHGSDRHITSIDFDPASGILYGVDANTRSLVTLSTETGKATLLPSHGMSYITGLAIGPDR